MDIAERYVYSQGADLMMFMGQPNMAVYIAGKEGMR